MLYFYMEKDYNKEAKLYIKRVLLEEDITYGNLAIKLQEAGFDYSMDSIRTKVNRGRFDFAFVLQICDVLGYKVDISKDN